MSSVLQSAANVSNVSSGFANSMDLFGPLLIVLYVVVVMGLLITARSSDHFERLVDALGLLAVSVYYAIHGVAAVTALAVLSTPAYLVATADPSTRSMVGRYAVIAIGGYALLAIVGYASKHYVVDPIRENVDEAGLLPEPEEDVEEVAD